MDEAHSDKDWMPAPSTAKVEAADIYQALIDLSGNISAVARHFGMTRAYIKKRIDSTPALVALLEDMREEVVDQAEQNVFADVLKNDPTANRYVLSTLGKQRGWSQGVAGTGKDGEIVVVVNKLTQAPADGD